VLAASVAVAALAAGCTSGRAAAPPTWVPQPEISRNFEPQPELPNPVLPAPQPEPSDPGSGSPGPGDPNATPSPSPSGPRQDPLVVATRLNQPTGLVVLPDNTALVGERTTGRIVRVQPRPGQPVRLEQTLGGLDASGDGGLLDLAISPTFNQDGLIYAYVTTAADNRVVHFALGSTPTPVLTGIPKGRTGNVGRIAFDATGALLVGTGDAGTPANAANPNSLAGKILRTDDLGRAVSGNPNPGSVVFASGLRTVDGLCVNPETGTRFAISTSPQDEVNTIKSGKNYGWPSDGAGTTPPLKTLKPNSGARGCTVLDGRLIIATSTGSALLVASLNQTETPQAFTETIRKNYGRLRTVVGALDGAVWVTTTNRDGLGTPTVDDDRVLRIENLESGGGSVV